MAALVAVLWSSAASTQLPLHAADHSEGGNGVGKPAFLDQPLSEKQTAQLRERLTAAEADLSAISAPGALGAGAPVGAPESELLERRSLLYQLARAYEQQLEDAQKLEQMRARRRQVEQEDREWIDFEDPPPHSVIVVDSLREKVLSLKRTVDLLQSNLAVATRRGEQSAEALARSEQRLRLASERLETAQDQAQTVRLTWGRSLAELCNRADAASTATLALSVKVRQEELAEGRARLAFAQRKLDRAEQAQQFTAQDLETVRRRLDTERRGLETDLEAALTRQRESHRMYDEAVKRLKQAGTAKAAGAKESTRAVAARALLADSIELRRIRLENADIRVEMLRQMLDIVERERRIWDQRFAVVNDGDVAKARDAYGRLAAVIQEAKAWKDHIGQQIEVSLGQVDELETRFEHAGTSGEVVRLRPLLNEYREREGLYRRAMERSQQFNRLLELLQVRFAKLEEALPLKARAWAWLAATSHTMTRIWEFEIVAVEDTIEVEGQSVSGRRSVTVGKMIRLILLLTIGYWGCVVLAKYARRLAVSRLQMEENLADILRKWTLAILFAFLVIVTLMWVKIPLTVFAFLGGALAIGVGFGTQNLIKNFFSGLSLLIERPLRVGDLIEVEGIIGEVRTIGFRSSTIRDGNGAEMHIPNSQLLERNLINWTYSNRLKRFALKVGVVYGAPIERVRELLTEAATRHRLVLKDPEPLVLFEDFGDNALIFSLYYWVSLVPGVNPAAVGSDLRFEIDKNLAAERIAISYPQRDVHIDAVRPIQVRLMGPSDERLREKEPHES